MTPVPPKHLVNSAFWRTAERREAFGCYRPALQRRSSMAQFPLLWIERRNYPGFRRIEALCFHADYEDWLEDYSRRVMELHEQRHAIVPVEFDGEAFESYCARYGLPPEDRKSTRLNSSHMS